MALKFDADPLDLSLQSLYIRMSTARPYEIVVWGATGSVGKLVCEHVAQNYQVRMITDLSRFCCTCCTRKALCNFTLADVIRILSTTPLLLQVRRFRYVACRVA